MRASFLSSPVFEAWQLVAGATGKPRRSLLLPRLRAGKSWKKETTGQAGPTARATPPVSLRR